jgi:hypothetical protein
MAREPGEAAGLGLGALERRRGRYVEREPGRACLDDDVIAIVQHHGVAARDTQARREGGENDAYTETRKWPTPA